jgi:hypothetical protein
LGGEWYDLLIAAHRQFGGFIAVIRANSALSETDYRR